ncbi:LysR family transcriptional regulator [Paenibacillus chartarius]|uniref:LysR family transcriptional regulator n=1 Tax=Paenibacillus chartarius TaxID=747481 RepID=A0ABV6DGZ5_9BACL
MRFQDLEGLMEAVRLGSISKASEMLHISHTALGKQIRSLEAYYGVQLLKRTSSGVVPTEAGTYLINRAAGLMSEFESIHSELRRYREPASYTIGALPSLSASCLPDRILAMKKDGMDSQVQIMHTSDELWDRLENGQMDGILAELSTAHKVPFVKILFHEPYVAVVHAEHAFGKLPSIEPQELDGQQLILYPQGCGIRKWVEAAMKQHRFTPVIASEVGFGGFIAGMVAAKAGITVLPESSAVRLGEPNLAVVPFAGQAAHRTIVFAACRKEVGRRLWPYFKHS